VIDDVGQQDVLAPAERIAGHPDEAQQRADQAFDLVVFGFGEGDLVDVIAGPRSVERADHVEGNTGR